MSDESEVVVVEEVKVEQKVGTGFTTIEDAMKEIERLSSINKEVIASRDETKTKLRAFETEAEEKARLILEEQGKYKEMFEASEAKRIAVETAVRTREVDATLKAELEKVGALSVDTVKKLINKSVFEFNEDGSIKVDSVKDQIKELMKSDPVLFGTEKAPDVKRAGDGENVSTFETELRKAKTQKEIQAVLTKYGKVK